MRQLLGVLALSAAVGVTAAAALQANAPQQQAAAQSDRIFPPAPARDAEFRAGTMPIDTPGLVRPELSTMAPPKYTSETLREKLEGTVTVEAVVGATGRVERVRIAEGLDYRLDPQALEAMLAWRFFPATLNGQPVPVVVTSLLEFRIH